MPRNVNNIDTIHRLRSLGLHTLLKSSMEVFLGTKCMLSETCYVMFEQVIHGGLSPWGGLARKILHHLLPLHLWWMV